MARCRRTCVLLISAMYIKVTVTPDAKRGEVLQKNTHEFLVSVRESAEQNRANTAVRIALAEHFQVSPAQVRIISGHHLRRKMVSVDVEDTVQ